MGCSCVPQGGNLSLTRFFVDSSRIRDAEVEFDSRDSHHLAVVLKRRAGDAVLVCDGKGTEYCVVLAQISKGQTVGRITDKYRLATEPATQITVAQALPKTLDKLEWVLQHGTELGARQFLPFYSARSREDWSRLLPKRERWQEIVRSAAEQSRRAFCPEVQPISSFEDIIARATSYDLALFAFEDEKEISLKTTLEQVCATSVLIVVGPEGGFTAGEAAAAKENLFKSVSLGPRILRTETAALCLLSQIYYAYEIL